MRQILSIFVAASLTAGCAPENVQQESFTPSEGAEEGAANADEDFLVERTSAHNFEETVAKLREGIAARPLTLFAEIDHAEGAAKADLELGSSTLFVFGNPKGGTPLIAQEPRMGIALPLKVLVFEADGRVILAHQDMASLARQYGLDPKAQPISNIAQMLEELTQAATQ